MKKIFFTACRAGRVPAFRPGAAAGLLHRWPSAFLGGKVLCAALLAAALGTAPEARASYCLESSFTNSATDDSTFTITNKCQGTLKVWVRTCGAVAGTTNCDSQGLLSTSYDLSKDQTKTETVAGRIIKNISCTTSGSDSVYDGTSRNICTISESDYTAFANGAKACKDKWSESQASDYCGEESVRWAIIEGKRLCYMWADCFPPGRNEAAHTQERAIGLYAEDIPGVYSCLDGLQDGECSGSGWETCGADRYCGSGDCRWHFEQSPAASVCTDWTSVISEAELCETEATCEGRTEVTRLATFVWDTDEVVNCAGAMHLVCP